jgi:hypothetical protein
VEKAVIVHYQSLNITPFLLGLGPRKNRRAPRKKRGEHMMIQGKGDDRDRSPTRRARERESERKKETEREREK